MAMQPLVDAGARQVALSAHDRTLLVEAGAGSGKTAILAGRIVLMLMQGVKPKEIAAVTFTELAASELLFRVRDFVSRVAAGDIPNELRLALPDGPSAAQKATLSVAESGIDDITCSTIHGFCQRLIRPYPVEANVDPGASIMDPDQAKLAFAEIVQDWLHEELDTEKGGLLADLMLANPTATIGLVNTVLEHQRQHENLQVPAVPQLQVLIHAFSAASTAYSLFVDSTPVKELGTIEFSTAFASMAQALAQIDISTSAGLVELVQSRAPESVCKADGDFKKYQKKTKWVEAAKQIGRSKADGESNNAQAQSLHEECCSTWKQVLAGAATRILSDLLPIIKPAVERMRAYKRSTALLDFDDLLHATKNVLRSHPDVRKALASHFRYVLVDEFQDTDPVQTEIFWRLCGDPATGGTEDDWRNFRIRPGALFLVGDPKQAIYRFRGADVNAYIWAREAFKGGDAQSVISIAVNFRSRAPILEYVNSRFSEPLAQRGQPGFIALEVFHQSPSDRPCVVALDVTIAGNDGKPSATQVRDAEAEEVARLCAHLIGNQLVTDPSTGNQRHCKAGDIALLAPTGADLWRYEQALEDYGVSVATQAGKGLFRRQEIQDLIAITRVIADGRDTLALGALLRGPLVGLADEEIFDIVWSQRDDVTQTLPALSLSLDAQKIEHAVAREVILKLQLFRRRVRETTPHCLLSQAVDELRVRQVLVQRCGQQAERALANVDLFLNLSLAYEIRGLKAFAESMTAAWEDKSRTVEGRPDAQEDSVALYSMHAAKGLEWPVVVPINGMTTVMAPDADVLDRSTNTLYCPVLGIAPIGHEQAIEHEKGELERERIRLWYVATTRARDLLVVPRVDVETPSKAWRALIDLDVELLSPYALPEEVQPLGTDAADSPCNQTREVFAEQASRIDEGRHDMVWTAPSRDEDVNASFTSVETSKIFVISSTDTSQEVSSSIAVQGGRERGLLLHKLLEEVLNGEIGDERESLSTRARELAAALNVDVFEEASNGISPNELADTVRRALAVGPVAAIRKNLVPELNAYSAFVDGGVEHVNMGVVDAIAFNDDGTAAAVIDWKSDVEPTADAITRYIDQVRSYLDMTGAPHGYIVFATTGSVHEVKRGA